MAVNALSIPFISRRDISVNRMYNALVVGMS